LAGGAPPSTWRAAFQREVKAAHPDRGGDPDRLRLVVEAYRILQLLQPAPRQTAAPAFKAARPEARPRARPTPRPAPKPAPDAKVEPEPQAAETPTSAHRPTCPISIVEAFLGCEKTVKMKDRGKFKVRLPGGLQTGDVMRFGADGEHYLTIQVQPHPGADLRGTDLWLRVSVSAEFLKEGGRMEVDTPLGPRKFWVSRTSAARGLFRAPGEGLPARGARAKGDLYLKFELDESLNQSPSRSLLERFAAVWAPV
jgi:curved DNA-binding protein